MPNSSVSAAPEQVAIQLQLKTREKQNSLELITKRSLLKINKNTTKGKWLEIKGDLQKAWGKLTDDDLEKSKGDIKKIAGLIQQRYGEIQKSSSEKLSNIFKKYE